MTTIKYIGRKTDFRGKTLWELLGNLKNFGIGRIVVRSMFERYPEPSYMKIVKVEALPNEEVRKVKVTVEKTFRGRTYPKLAVLESTTYKADYRLLPKDQEQEYCKLGAAVPEKIFPEFIEFPPLMKQFVMEETKELNPQLKLIIKEGRDKNCRIAKDGETPNVNIITGLGKPAAPKLYENV